MTEDDRSRTRIDVLEATVRDLLGEVGRLRVEVEALRRGTAGPARPPAVRPMAKLAAATPDVEALVGRYGAMGLAALAILSAVGIFLSWAIAQDLIGPEARVAAGFLVALAIGALGWRLRSRGARTFGNTLVAIALALIHVVAWGAGPALLVVPATFALAAAALASVALAILAWRSNEQSLFVVGTGGALVAPFVTSSGRGDGEVLLIFGFVVLTAALRGIHDRPWIAARRLLGVAGFSYALIVMTAAWSADGRLGKDAPVVFAIVCAWGALALGGLHASPLARAYLSAAVLPLIYNYDVAGVLVPHMVLAAMATATLYVAIHRSGEPSGSWLASALVLPLAFLGAAILPLEDRLSTTGAVNALGWSVAAAAAGWPAPGARREAHWCVAAMATGIAIVLALHDRDVSLVVALSGLAALVSWVAQRERGVLIIVPGVMALLAGALVVSKLFYLRVPYGYIPFFTSASLGAASLVAGAAMLGRNAATARWTAGSPGPRAEAMVGSLGLIAAFVWGRMELADAFSPDLATFLLIGYFAATGVASIFVGRQRGLTGLRRIGLAIAVYAALKAIVQAYALDAIGLRVGSFLLVGAFLLGVAYWYRTAGDEPDPGVVPGVDPGPDSASS